MNKTKLKLIYKGGLGQENTYKCEECKATFYEQPIDKWKYCPVCGREIEDNPAID